VATTGVSEQRQGVECEEIPRSAERKRPLTERDSGEGRLVSLVADQRTYIVDYDLTVDSEVTGSSGTFSPPRVLTRHLLRITARNNDNNERIPNGEFTLQTQNEILRVRRSQGQWSVVQP